MHNEARCGYCGIEFDISALDSSTRQVLDHLEDAHAIGNCARVRFEDGMYFRWHLERCHGATMGPWLNSVGLACKTERPP
jgi:hypothetical protein